MATFSTVFLWWALIFLIGIICLPTTLLIFRQFIDQGYIFTKILGIVFSSYILWLLSSVHILPFTRITGLLVLLGLFLGNQWIRTKFKDKLPTSLPWGLIIFEEILFFICLAFWAYVRSAEPSIHGLEKFMDFGFVNSILRTPYFPPADMWLTKSPDYTGGYFINYYYFGHYITAFLTKLSGIDPAITYNLMMATLFAFTFTLPFSLGANMINFFYKEKDSYEQKKSKALTSSNSLIRNVFVGLLTGYLVALGGNLHTLYIFTEGYPNEEPKAPWQVKWGYHPDRYWYPNATRFIPFTIHEFPSYSFVVADLHGHVSDIPIVFLAVAFLLTLLTSTSSKKEKEVKKTANTSFLSDLSNHLIIPIPALGFLGLLLGVMYMTNAWDGLIYMLLSVLVFVFLLAKSDTHSISFFSKERLSKIFTTSLFLLFFFLLINLPFSLNFKPFASGVGVLCAPSSFVGKSFGPLLFEAEKCQKSPLFMMAILWGFFYFSVFGYFAFYFFPKMKMQRNQSKTQDLNTLKKESHSAVSIAYHLTSVEVFAILLIIISTFLLIFPEFFYLKDIYPAHYRANTMFKLGYQAFMLLGLVSVFIIFRLKSLYTTGSKKMLLVLYNGTWIALFSLVAIYPYFGISSYYGGLKTTQGLNGINWMDTQYENDREAIEWLRANIPDTLQPVIAEANGDSYTDYARVSAYTGLPTIIGWPVHEWLWRGSYDEAGKRIPEVAKLYESSDVEETKKIIKKYNVSYVFVGNLEREKYQKLNESKFNTLGKIVFESGNTRVYKLEVL